MIPTAILLGMIGGLIPRYRWWSVPVIGFVWSVILSVSGDPTMSLGQIWIAGFALGAVNGAVGVLLTVAVANAVNFVSRWLRSSREAPK
ncbi:MAG: hypothetical protein IH818_14055 [Acidobacteria bacterium]|nr:hypothetical protein [Acidobacteriota bacterium]